LSVRGFGAFLLGALLALAVMWTVTWPFFLVGAQRPHAQARVGRFGYSWPSPAEDPLRHPERVLSDREPAAARSDMLAAPPVTRSAWRIGRQGAAEVGPRRRPVAHDRACPAYRAV
jgi:hypothetical protein